MKIERSVGAVVFRKAPKEILYLLLRHYPGKFNAKSKKAGGRWDSPKGHIEKGEKSLDTLRREVREETGIAKLKVVPGFKETIHYFVGPRSERSLKFVAFFLAETNQKKVKLSFEHQGFAWLPFREALKLVTYANSKNVLKSANKFLRR